ncbi:MAG: DUF952 domain-containing protein [Plectolyngbya sp. WJT66-NPBG17]|jgi:uncharacterized protein (DUF952 family)|nr:DUF952 domain-containing protein [Plectolyngbya sp. WJT66-NPBG17]MBW4526985.1 DUF952 domain-containing protein [Phormidium tanganyikae FI6-MK23]
MLLHITERDRVPQSGVYRADSLDTEGFIHCSTRDQVVWVANQFYRGNTSLVLLVIDPDRVHAEIKYETVEGVGDFPHIYGELNADAIVQVVDFPPNADDSFNLPNEFVT